jgi:GMP synthase-like glutamine amidotransferase
VTAYILNHVGYDDPGYIGIALNQLGIAWQMRYREFLTAHHRELPGDAELVILLGSLWDPTDTAVPEVRTELSLINKSREANIPIFGVCYGAQLLALSSGAMLHRLSFPNVGYREVSFNGNWQPPSSQFFWNHIGFDTPPGASSLAEGPQSSWAYEEERILAVQFHADATPALLRRWTSEGSAELAELQVDPRDVLADAERASAAVQSFTSHAIRGLLSV